MGIGRAVGGALGSTMGLGGLASGLMIGSLYDSYVNKKEKKAQSAIDAANTNAQKQAAIAEDERLRRLRLLQGGSANAMEEATGRKTLLGQ